MLRKVSISISSKSTEVLYSDFVRSVENSESCETCPAVRKGEHVMKEQSTAALMGVGVMFFFIFMAMNFILFLRIIASTVTGRRSSPVSKSSSWTPTLSFAGALLGAVIGCGLAARLGNARDFGMLGMLIGLPVGAFAGLISGLIIDGYSSSRTPETATKQSTLPETPDSSNNDSDTMDSDSKQD